MLDSLNRFQIHLAAGSKSPATIATYASIIEAFFAFSGTKAETAPTRAAVESFLGRPRADGLTRAVGTRNQALAALRAFSSLAVRELGWETDPTAGITFVREARRDPAVLDTGELRRLFLVAAEAAEPISRARDLAMLAILSQVGLRVHELVALDVAQVDLTSATLLAIAGKGGSSADLPLNAPAVALIIAWLGGRPQMAHEGEPALFVSRHGTRLSKRAAQHLLRRLRDAMGTKKKLSCHTLRHSCATLALTVGGADLSTVAELLRHSDLNTTRKYLHLIDTRRREAVRRLGSTVPAEILGPVNAVGEVPAALVARQPENDIAQVRDSHALSGEAPKTEAIPLVAEDDFYDGADSGLPSLAA